MTKLIMVERVLLTNESAKVQKTGDDESPINQRLSAVSPVALASRAFGGKAAGLASLVSAGMPVPAAIAITAELVTRISGQRASPEELASISKFLNSHPGAKFAVRSSAAQEDGSQFSFAGIYESKLSVANDIESIQQAIAELTKIVDANRVSAYRSANRITSPSEPDLAVVIQVMVDAEISGVAFSSAIGVDGSPIMLVECVKGLGDALVSGRVRPTRVEIPVTTSGQFDIDATRLTGRPLFVNGLEPLCSAVRDIQRHFGQPMDIEWAIDKEDRLWILQARPITRLVVVGAKPKGPSGVPASPGVATGPAFVVHGKEELEAFPSGAILIAEVTDTNFLPALRRAAAVVTEEGGMLSHAAIVARELGVPCVVGYRSARQTFASGIHIRVDGDTGTVVTTAEDTPPASNSRLAVNEVDWRAVYNFSQMLPVTFGDTTVLFENTLSGLVAHVPRETRPDLMERIGSFCLNTFGDSVDCYASDKYLWFFEWTRFQGNPLFLRLFQLSDEMSAKLDSELLADHYDFVLKIGRELRDGVSSEAPGPDRFLIQESLMSLHFLLTMIIPEGLSIKNLFAATIRRPEFARVKFVDILSGSDTLKDVPILKAAANYAKTLAGLRNSIYSQLVDEGFISDAYFEDRDDRARAALHELGIEVPEGLDPVSVFYENITRVQMYRSHPLFARSLDLPSVS